MAGDTLCVSEVSSRFRHGPGVRDPFARTFILLPVCPWSFDGVSQHPRVVGIGPGERSQPEAGAVGCQGAALRPMPTVDARTRRGRSSSPCHKTREAGDDRLPRPAGRRSTCTEPQRRCCGSSRAGQYPGVIAAGARPLTDPLGQVRSKYPAWTVESRAAASHGSVIGPSAPCTRADWTGTATRTGSCGRGAGLRATATSSCRVIGDIPSRSVAARSTSIGWSCTTSSDRAFTRVFTVVLRSPGRTGRSWLTILTGTRSTMIQTIWCHPAVAATFGADLRIRVSRCRRRACSAAPRSNPLAHGSTAQEHA